MASRKSENVPTGALRRAAKVGGVIGGHGVKYAGTRVLNLGREKEVAKDALDDRHLDAARGMVKTLGNLKGAALKVGQLASFVDTEFIPEEYRELYQEELASLRTHAPAMPWKKVKHVLDEAYGEPVSKVFAKFETKAIAAASIGQVHRATLHDGREVAVKIQYPDIADALRADLQNVRMLVTLAKAIAPGLDAKAIAGELRERILEELDYEFEAQNQRSFARAYRDHPFIYIPDVVVELSHERVLVTEWVDGKDFNWLKRRPKKERDRAGEIFYRFYYGSIYHLQQFNADSHPGNCLVMPDGKIAFLDFGMVKRLTTEQIELQIAAIDALLEQNPQAVLKALDDLGFLPNPKKIDADRLLEQVNAIGGWYLTDAETTIDSELVMRVLSSASDPRSEYFDMMRRQTLPAEELMGRRMETGVLAVLGQLRATGNWQAIGSEWWYASEPTTELGRAEWEYFEARGERHTRKFRARR